MKQIDKDICVVTASSGSREWEFIVNAQDPNMALSYFQSMLKELEKKGELNLSAQPARLDDKKVGVIG